MLSVVNAHPRDAFIQFEEEGHIYTIHGERGTYVSTTSLVHKQFAEFDADAVVNNLIKSGKTADPDNKYYGMTRESILEQWADTAKAASGSGTKMHYDIECYSNDQPVDNDSIEFRQFLDFRAAYPHLKPYRTEWTVYYEEYKICGSIDMVYWNELTKGYEIYDWKRSKEIAFHSCFGKKKSKTPGLGHITDTNYWHYSFQLNIYKRILEEKYNVQITGMFLLCLHPDHVSYERIEVEPMPREMDIIFANRLQEITAAAATAAQVHGCALPGCTAAET
jgi:hypothetical protein